MENPGVVADAAGVASGLMPRALSQDTPPRGARRLTLQGKVVTSGAARLPRKRTQGTPPGVAPAQHPLSITLGVASGDPGVVADAAGEASGLMPRALSQDTPPRGEWHITWQHQVVTLGGKYCRGNEREARRHRPVVHGA